MDKLKWKVLQAPNGDVIRVAIDGLYMYLIRELPEYSIYPVDKQYLPARNSVMTIGSPDSLQKAYDIVQEDRPINAVIQEHEREYFDVH